MVLVLAIICGAWLAAAAAIVALCRACRNIDEQLDRDRLEADRAVHRLPFAS
jgi:hypothetical protein